jgi:hypothetical protein
MDSQSLYQTSYFSTLSLAYFPSQTPLTANASFFDVALSYVPPSLSTHQMSVCPGEQSEKALFLIKMDHVCQQLGP